MLRHALRRLLWLIPAGLGLTLLAFYLLSLMPGPRTAPAAAEAGAAVPEPPRRRARERPLFVNLAPEDVSTKAAAAVARLAVGADDESMRAAAELGRLGGAALPYVLPALDSLTPEARSRVALALAPVAVRMGIGDPATLGSPADAVLFWTRYWETRAVDFRAGTVRAAVRRFAQHGQEARAEDLRVLDTFVLEAVLGELEVPTDRSSVERAARLIDLAAAATARDDRISMQDDPTVAARCVERWQAWWRSNEADYTTRRGAGRFAAIVLDTEFGRWGIEVLATGLGPGDAGRPAHLELLGRGRVSAGVLLLGLALAYAGAALLGAASAARRGSALDHALGVVPLAIHLGSAALLGTVALALGWGAGAGASPARVALAALLLALTLLAEPSRQLRAALLPALAAPHVRAATARGAQRARVVVVHALRTALVPLCARAPIEPAAAWTGVFVLEHALGLPGLGNATLRAVEQGNTRWLMALVVLGVCCSVVSLVLGDVATALADPRLRSVVLRPTRRGG